MSVITELGYWTGLLDWTTGLEFQCTKNLFNKINFTVQLYTALLWPVTVVGMVELGPSLSLRKNERSLSAGHCFC